jgi:hypothetical protein
MAIHPGNAVGGYGLWLFCSCSHFVTMTMHPAVIAINSRTERHIVSQNRFPKTSIAIFLKAQLVVMIKHWTISDVPGDAYFSILI